VATAGRDSSGHRISDATQIHAHKLRRDQSHLGYCSRNPVLRKCAPAQASSPTSEHCQVRSLASNCVMRTSYVAESCCVSPSATRWKAVLTRSTPIDAMCTGMILARGTVTAHFFRENETLCLQDLYVYFHPIAKSRSSQRFNDTRQRVLDCRSRYSISLYRRRTVSTSSFPVGVLHPSMGAPAAIKSRATSA